MTRLLSTKHKSPGSASFSNLYNKCKHTAKQRNLEFNLSRIEHCYLIVQNCHYCNSPPIKHNSYLKNKGKDQVRPNRYAKETIDRNWIMANGIDRIDNNEGYFIQNCVPCCAICNYIKCDMGYNEFIAWIKKVYCNVCNKEKDEARTNNN